MTWKWVDKRVTLLLSFLVLEFRAEFLGKTLEMQPLMADYCSCTTSTISFCTQNQATNSHNCFLLPCAGQLFANIWGWQFRNQSGSVISFSQCIYCKWLHNLILANVLPLPMRGKKKYFLLLRNKRQKKSPTCVILCPRSVEDMNS